MHNTISLLALLKKVYQNGHHSLLQVIAFVKRHYHVDVKVAQQFVNQNANDIKGGWPMTDLQKRFPGNPTVEVGVDGMAAYAMLGEDLQSGHAEFVDIVQKKGEPLALAEYRAKSLALQLLRNNYGSGNIPYLNELKDGITLKSNNLPKFRNPPPPPPAVASNTHWTND